MFISFEGVDGSGKTTQIDMLYRYFLSKNIPCVATKEPGGNDLALKLRQIILNETLDSKTQLLLINAARMENVQKVILPSLDAGKIVLCDRFIGSTIVYQGLQGGLGIDFVMQNHQMFLNSIMPDATIYLKLNPAQALQRLSDRDLFDSFDAQTSANISKMVDYYDSIYTHNKNSQITKIHTNTKIITINASDGDANTIFQLVLQNLKSHGFVF
jgi:dTMP kinase